jgi:hypothetical protein
VSCAFFIWCERRITDHSWTAGWQVRAPFAARRVCAARGGVGMRSAAAFGMAGGSVVGWLGGCVPCTVRWRSRARCVWLCGMGAARTCGRGVGGRVFFPRQGRALPALASCLSPTNLEICLYAGLPNNWSRCAICPKGRHHRAATHIAPAASGGERVCAARANGVGTRTRRDR